MHTFIEGRKPGEEEASAVVDKHFVDKIGEKTAILRIYDMSTKILFCDFCRHNVLFWKSKDTFKKQNIEFKKKAWRFAKSSLSSKCSGMLDAQPIVYLASLNDPWSHNSKFGFWSEHHCIYFLTIVLSTNIIVAVRMKFDPTCRQRSLSSMTALEEANFKKALWLCHLLARSPGVSWYLSIIIMIMIIIITGFYKLAFPIKIKALHSVLLPRS